MIGLSRADKLAIASGIMGLAALVIWMTVLWPGSTWRHVLIFRTSRTNQAVANEWRSLGAPERVVAMGYGLRQVVQWWWFLLAPAGLALAIMARRAGNRLLGEVVIYMNAVACAMSIPGVIKVALSPWFPAGGWGP